MRRHKLLQEIYKHAETIHAKKDIINPVSLFLIRNPSIDDGAIYFHLLSSIPHVLHHLRLKYSLISEIEPSKDSEILFIIVII